MQALLSICCVVDDGHRRTQSECSSLASVPCSLCAIVFWLFTAFVRLWLQKSRALQYFTKNALQLLKAFHRHHRHAHHQFSTISPVKIEILGSVRKVGGVSKRSRATVRPCSWRTSVSTAWSMISRQHSGARLLWRYMVFSLLYMFAI